MNPNIATAILEFLNHTPIQGFNQIDTMNACRQTLMRIVEEFNIDAVKRQITPAAGGLGPDVASPQE